jgi:hypothetical protein
MKWDFFIAHAGADAETARKLYRLLKPHARVFLDSECLHYGDKWDDELARAQRDSSASLILISLHSEKAFYQGDEIATSVRLFRKDRTKHRVIPVYLHPDAETPYGLEHFHSVTLSKDVTLETFAASLMIQFEVRNEKSSLEGVSGDLDAKNEQLTRSVNRSELDRTMTEGMSSLERLQYAMRRQNEEFTTIANVLKTRHDTVKNTISNAREIPES